MLLRRGAGSSESGIIKATAILAPVSVVLGLLILIFHLARPWTFWKLMFHYQFDSVMSMGVMLFQVYMALLFAWLAVVFRTEIETLRRHLLQEKFAFVDDPSLGLPASSGCWRRSCCCSPCSWGLHRLSAVGAQDLSAVEQPSVAGAVPHLRRQLRHRFHHLAGGHSVQGEPSQPGVSFVHRFELPVLAVEVLLLVCFFTGLYFGGGQKEAAMWAAIGSGFWAQVFWLGVVGIGMLLPQLLALLAPAPLRAKNGYLVLVCSLTLVGILLLRYFVLYAGQMTVV